MNMFLVAGAVVAIIVIAAALVYVPQISGTTAPESSNMPVSVGEDVDETAAGEPVQEGSQEAQPPAEVQPEEKPAETPTGGAEEATKPLQEVPTDGRPDLVLEGITLDPKTPLVNELITFTAAIRNKGNADVESFSFTLSPLVDQVSIISAASAASSSVPAGGMTTIRMQAKIAVPGPTKVKSTIDTFNIINESNETNNQLVVPFRIYTKQSWAGCSGNGKSVCADLVDAGYFTQYPNCTAAYNCTSFITGCDAECPFPR